MAHLVSLRRRRLDVQGADLEIAYRECGAGPPVVLLHGLGASACAWHLQEPALAAGHRVYVPDLPGYGASPPVRHPHRPAWAECLVATFIEQVAGEPVALVGHSMGGLVAVLCALSRPDLVSALVLVSSAGLGREISASLRLLCLPGVDRALELCLPPLVRLGGERAAEAMRRRFAGTADAEALGPVLAEAFARIRRPAGVRAFMAPLRAGVGLRGQRSHCLIGDRLGELKMPTLLAWGRRDDVLPLAQAERAAAAAGLDLEVLEEAGHSPHLEAPVAFNALLCEFLAGQRGDTEPSPALAPAG